jgi:hypothetical protein
LRLPAGVACAQQHADRFLIVYDQAEDFANGQLILGLAEKPRLPTIYPCGAYAMPE